MSLLNILLLLWFAICCCNLTQARNMVIRSRDTYYIWKSCIETKLLNTVRQIKNASQKSKATCNDTGGLESTTELSFMLPGNTKFRPDSYFGLFKRHYRRQDHVNDMADLVDCVQLCGQNVACVPQLYQDWQYYNWNAYLGQWWSSGWLWLLPHIWVRQGPPGCHENAKDHAFRHQLHWGNHAEGRSNCTGHMGCLPGNATCYHTNWIIPSAVIVPVQDGQGICCDLKKRDVCSKPPPDTGASSSYSCAKASLLPEIDQPGPFNWYSSLTYCRWSRVCRSYTQQWIARRRQRQCSWQEETQVQGNCEQNAVVGREYCSSKNSTLQLQLQDNVQVQSSTCGPTETNGKETLLQVREFTITNTYVHEIKQKKSFRTQHIDVWHFKFPREALCILFF